jgi:hypothetical protein
MSDYDLINGEILTVTVTVDEETVVANINTAARGPAGPAGSGTNSVTSATTSDGTAALYLDSIRFEATNGGPTQLGEMAWESTDGSIDAMLESGVIVAMGEDLVIRVRNTTASPITKGTALAYDGTSGASGRIKVKPWVGANISTAKLFLGFAACDIPANSNGYSQWFGKLAGINTSGGAQTWLDEQIIYAVPGASATLTNIAPTSGEYAAAAVVINAGSGTSGILLVRPTFEVASATLATPNTLVLRDGSGGASFAGMTVSGSVTNSANNFFTAQQDFPDSATWLYTASSKANHLSSLGAGTTGSALFGAATAAAARTTLELGAFAANGSITGTGALTFAAGGSNQNINLTPSGTGTVSTGATVVITKSGTAGFNIRNTGATFTNSVAVGGVGNINLYANWDAITNSQSDTSKVSLAVRLRVDTDSWQFVRVAAGAGTAETIPFSVSGAGALESLYQRFGSGTPEGVVTAPVGAVFHRTNGGAGTSFYVKESGTGNTGWVAK